MAKQDLSRYQEGIVKRYYEHRDTLMLDKLGDIVSDLWLSEDPKKTDKLWQAAEKALANMGVGPERMATVVGARDHKALAALVTELTSGSPKAAAPPSPASGPAAAPPPANTAPSAPAPKASPAEPTAEDLKRAYKAFKRRLKVTRLDQSGGSARSPVTSGGGRVVAISPPSEYSKAVWDALVAQGRLRYAGSGMYEVVNPNA